MVGGLASRGSIGAGLGVQAATGLVTPYYIAFAGAGYGTINGSGSLANLPLINFTIDGWIALSAAGANEQRLFSHSYHLPSGWILARAGGTPPWLIDCRVYLPNVGEARTYGGNVTNDVWHHYAAIWDATAKAFDLYIDGTLRNSLKVDRPTGVYTADSSTMYFASGGGLSNPLYGGVGWQRISNGKLWSADFVAPQRVPPPLSDANTLALWRMMDGPGSTAIDSSGNGKDITLLGTYSWMTY